MEDGWISVEEKLPDSGGQYWCTDGVHEFPAFLTKKLSGQKTWLTLNESKITHWKELYKEPKVT